VRSCCCCLALTLAGVVAGDRTLEMVLLLTREPWKLETAHSVQVCRCRGSIVPSLFLALLTPFLKTIMPIILFGEQATSFLVGRLFSVLDSDARQGLSDDGRTRKTSHSDHLRVFPILSLALLAIPSSYVQYRSTYILSHTKEGIVCVQEDICITCINTDRYRTRVSIL